MSQQKVTRILEEYPVIASFNGKNSLNEAIQTDCNIIFILNANIINIGQIIDKIKQQNKMVFVHVDLLEGSSSREVTLEFLSKNTNADGIISTKAYMVNAARKYGFYTIHRFFLTDSISFHSIDKQIASSNPDFIEVLPGGMSKVIRWVQEKVDIPIIASGLVCEKEDVVTALQAGAIGISSTNNEVWYM